MPRQPKSKQKKRPRSAPQSSHRSRDPFSTLLDSLTDASFSVNDRWEFTYLSPKAEVILSKLKRSPKDLIGKNLWEEFPDATKLPVYRLLKKSLKVKTPAQLEVFYPLLDSWFATHVYPSSNGLDIYLQNVTKRKKTESDLRDALQFNEQVISTAGQGIVVYDMEFRYVVWNSFMERLTGMSAREVLGKRGMDLFPYLQEQGVYDLLLRTVAGETTNSSSTFFFIPQTGKSGWLMGNYVPLRNAKGAIVGVIGVLSDVSEHKRIEEALTKSDERYRSFIAQSTEGIYRFDFRKPMPLDLSEEKQIEYIYKYGYHADCNLAMAQMYGYSNPKELIGKSPEELLPRSDQSNVDYLRSFVRAHYRLKDAESHERSKGGAIKYFLNNTIGIIEDGMLTHVWGTQRDVTEQKRSEEALRQSEVKYRTLVEQIHDSLMQVNNDDIVLFANKQFFELTGYSMDELLGQKASQILLDPENGAIIAEKNALRQKGVSDQYELEIRKKSGERIWVRVSGSPVYDNHGNVVGSVGLHTDITERKRSEQALRESEKKFRSLFENVFDGVYQSTPDGKLLAANPALVQMLGYNSEEEMKKLDIATETYLDPEQRKEFSALLERQGQLRNAELTLKRKDGTVIKVLENARAVRDETGSIRYYEGTLTEVTEQKAAEEALRQSELKYRSLIEQSNDAIYLLVGGKFEVVNKQFAEFFGVTADEVRSPGFNFLELVAPESVPVIEERQRKTARGEEVPLRYEFTARSRDGRLIPMEASVSYISYKEGRAVQGILRDVTERKNAEEGLKHMLSLLQSTLESTADGLLLVDNKGKIISVNRRFVQMWRIPQEIIDSGDDDQALQFVLDQLVDPEGFLKKVRELYSQPEVESFDILEFKDDRVFERYSIPQLSEGKPLGRVWSFRDVTTRRDAEEALRQSEAKFRTLFEESKDVIFISTTEGRFLDINGAGVELFGYSSKEELMKIDIGRDIYINEHDRKTMQRISEQYGFVRDYELTLKRKTGEKITVLETATAVRNDRGVIVAYRGIIRDITERKHLEEQLRQAQKLQSIGTLAGGIAHDFNNILGIIIGYVSRLSREKSNPERVDQSVDAITKAAQRGTSLVRQLLTFARQTDIQLESVNVNTVIEEVVRIVHETFPKSIIPSLELAQNLPSLIADSNQIHQALLNICLNAKDAMPNGGQLLVATEVVPGASLRPRLSKAVEESYLCIRITDTGHGMDEATLNRIFEPFFTTKRRSGGTGLGLSVVYGIVDSHRGFIDVTSSVGRGTTFRFYFPNPTVAVPPPAPKTTTQQEIPGGTETILVVEDETMLLELLQSTLEAKGYRVRAAQDGVEAVDIYKQYGREIAIVISDVGLPRLNGFETSAEIKKIDASAKILLASGYFEPSLKENMRTIGILAFVQKPYEPDEVLKTIRQILDGQ